MTEYSAASLRTHDCRPGQPKLAESDIDEALATLPGWSRSPDASARQKTYRFADYYRTIAFVNAVAWIA